jgi:uncharacterized membrane protein
MTLLSVFGGGLFLIPLMILAGAAIFGYQAHKAHNSNSWKRDRSGYHDNQGNVPYTEIGQFWFAVVLVASAIVVICLMVADK